MPVPAAGLQGRESERTQKISLQSQKGKAEINDAKIQEFFMRAYDSLISEGYISTTADTTRLPHLCFLCEAVFGAKLQSTDLDRFQEHHPGQWALTTFYQSRAQACHPKSPIALVIM